MKRKVKFELLSKAIDGNELLLITQAILKSSSMKDLAKIKV